MVIQYGNQMNHWHLSLNKNFDADVSIKRAGNLAKNIVSLK